MALGFRRNRVIPGFGLSLGYTLMYLSVVVLLPLSALFIRTGQLGWREFWKLATSEWVLSACRFSLGASLVAATVNIVFGMLVAWVLARYSFWGRRVVD